MRLSIAVISLSTLAACVEPSPKIVVPGETFYTKTAHGWRVACAERYRTGAGTVQGENACTMIQNNNAASAGLSVVADSKGRRISKPRAVDTHVCDVRPRAQGVDGVSIAGMPYAQQISALASGKSYFVERQSPWPYCTVTIAGEIPLRGFNEAFAIFDREAKLRGW